MDTQVSNKNVDEEFSDGLRRSRMAQGVTQRELAQRVSRLGYVMQSSTIYKIETGSRRATIGEAIVIAAALEVDITSIVDAERGSLAAIHARAIHRTTAAAMSAATELDEAIDLLRQRRLQLQRQLKEASDGLVTGAAPDNDVRLMAAAVTEYELETAELERWQKRFRESTQVQNLRRILNSSIGRSA